MGIVASLACSLCTTAGCQTWYGGMTLPSGRYLQHYPQYFAPDPAHPLPRELASMAAVEEPAGPRLGGGGAPAAPAPAGPPAAPVPIPAPAPKQ